MMAFLARWLTWDAAKALFYGAISTAVIGGLFALYQDIKGGATAQARLECTQAIAASSATEQERVDAVNFASESAAQHERDLHKNDGGKSTARALAIQTELQTLTKDGSDPVCFPKDLVGAMSK